MDEAEAKKLPLKRVELSLSKFNDVAIPHHLELLRQHKANIVKYSSSGEYSRVRAEQLHATRVSARLRALLAEMDALRRQLHESDRRAFDTLTQHSRDLTLRAIMDYLESEPVSASMSQGADEDEGALLLQVEGAQQSAAEREAVLRGWRALAGEVRALHEAWQVVQAAALAQRESVRGAEAAAEAAGAHVRAARGSLAAAERARGAAWCAGGAALGAAAGGPLGLLVGVKAGALAALAGSLLGYFTASRVTRPAPPAPEPEPPPHRHED